MRLPHPHPRFVSRPACWSSPGPGRTPGRPRRARSRRARPPTSRPRACRPSSCCTALRWRCARATGSSRSTAAARDPRGCTRSQRRRRRYGVDVLRISERELPEQLSIFPLTVAVQRIALGLAVELGTDPDSFGRDRPGPRRGLERSSTCNTGRVFERRLAPVELLSEPSLLALERGWMRLVSEIGIQFQHEGVLERFRAGGTARRGRRGAASTPSGCSSRSRKAPGSFELRGRRLEPAVRRRTAWPSAPCQSAPFVRDAGVRRNATFDDFRNFVRLTAGDRRARHAGLPDLRARRPRRRVAASRPAAAARDRDRQALRGGAVRSRSAAPTRSRCPRSCTAGATCCARTRRCSA